MNRIKRYYGWLRGAHAMKEQAESVPESMASRIDNYPELHARTEQHLSETRSQVVQLETILDRNDISRSVVKGSMNKIAALGQSIGSIFPPDGIVKGSVDGYVFEQFGAACYTSLLATAKNAGDTVSVPTIEAILNKERQMADWLIQNILQTTEKFLIRSETGDVEAKK